MRWNVILKILQRNITNAFITQQKCALKVQPINLICIACQSFLPFLYPNEISLPVELTLTMQNWNNDHLENVLSFLRKCRIFGVNHFEIGLSIVCQVVTQLNPHLTWKLIQLKNQSSLTLSRVLFNQCNQNSKQCENCHLIKAFKCHCNYVL